MVARGLSVCAPDAEGYGGRVHVNCSSPGPGCRKSAARLVVALWWRSTEICNQIAEILAAMKNLI